MAPLVLCHLFLTTGTGPNRILKVEWKNAGFSNNAAQTDYANFQVWLYEGSAKVEFHYGSINVTDGANSWDTGLGPTAAIDNSNGSEMIVLTGTPSNPTVNTTTNNGIWLTGAPASGMVYVFTRNGATGITHNSININNNIYLNPFNNLLNIDNATLAKECEVKIMDMTGKTIYQTKVNNNKSEINTENFSSGFYFVEIISDGKIGRKKLVKNLIVKLKK